MSEAALREELAALVAEREEREKFNKLAYFDPYPWQQAVLWSGKDHAQTLAMCANRVGKSYTGAAMMAIHATGLYPDDWEGHKWRHPIRAWAAGVSADSTRDILQNELLGTPEDPSVLGSGMIPRHCVGTTTRKQQVPNAFQTVLVKHHTDGVFDGWSKIDFKAFEQGEKKFMGTSQHEIWLDEQPPDGLFTQCITRTANTGGRVTMTFTPEDGMTPVIHQFTHDRKPGMNLIQATWADAPHLTQEVQEQLLAVYGEHERDMRSRGIPIFGSGPVFTTMEDEIRVDPFEIPDYWPALAGLDFGWDHPTAVVWLRYDPDSDCAYVVDVYRKSKAVVAIHAAAINARPRCPVIWPHDGYKHEAGSGVTLADQYRNSGVQMHPTHFLNPMAVGEKGQGNYKVEPGINHMSERLQSGRLKVFSTCYEWFEEYRLYHREDGKIYDVGEDLMSATRYAVQSLRFAEKIGVGASGFNRGFDSKITHIRSRLA